MMTLKLEGDIGSIQDNLKECVRIAQKLNIFVAVELNGYEFFVEPEADVFELYEEYLNR